MDFKIHFDKAEAQNGVNGEDPSTGKFSYLGLLFTLLLVLFTATILHTPPQKTITPETVEIGDIAGRDIVINRDITVTDQESTRTKQQEAVEKVIPIYEYSPQVEEQTISKIHAWIETIRNRKQDYKKNEDGDSTIIRMIIDETREQYGIEMTESQARQLLKAEQLFDRLALNKLFSFIKKIYASGVILSRTGTPKSKENLIRIVYPDDSKQVVNVGTLNDVDNLRSKLSAHFREQGLRESNARLLTKVLLPFFGINYSFSQSLTQKEKENVAENTLPVILKLKKGKVILRKGDEVDAEALKIIRLISSVESQKRGIPLFYLIAVTLIILYFSLGFLFKRWNSNDINRRKLLRVSAFTLMLSALLYRAGLFLFPLILKNLNFSISYNSESIFFALPFGVVALTIAFIFDLQSAVVIGFVNAIIGGMICGWDLNILLYILVGNLVVSFPLGSQNKLSRSTIFRSAFLTLLPMNLFFILFILLTNQTFSPGLLLTDLFMGAFSAILAALIASFIIPLWEIIFKLITDLKLSEFSNLNSTIFRELLEKAPGTYHHSQMVASLSESASNDLKLNTPLLSAMALYHDIGKIENPQFFSENSSIYPSQHENLPPKKSAQFIIDHVSAGVESGQKLNLPGPILDAIREHHGTKVTRYFYEKALQVSSIDPDDFDDSQFKYPGPRPRTIETAIIMLADQVEAATRSLESYTPEKVRNLISEIISSNIRDNQFDQCRGLTFMALNRIANSFAAKLSSIYHRRVSYPGFDFEKETGND